MKAGKNWQRIWEKREDHFANMDLQDDVAVFYELKRIDGFDIVSSGGGNP